MASSRELTQAEHLQLQEAYRGFLAEANRLNNGINTLLSTNEEEGLRKKLKDIQGALNPLIIDLTDVIDSKKPLLNHKRIAFFRNTLLECTTNLQEIIDLPEPMTELEDVILQQNTPPIPPQKEAQKEEAKDQKEEADLEDLSNLNKAEEAALLLKKNNEIENAIEKKLIELKNNLDYLASNEILAKDIFPIAAMQLRALLANDFPEDAKPIQDALAELIKTFNLPIETTEQKNHAQDEIKIAFTEVSMAITGSSSATVKKQTPNLLKQLNAIEEKTLSALKTNGQLVDNFNDMVSKLEKIAKNLSQTAFPKLLSRHQGASNPLNKIIGILTLSKTSKNLNTEPQLSAAIKKIKFLLREIEEKYQHDAEKKDLAQLFKNICEQAIINLKSREGLMASFYTDFHIIDNAIPVETAIKQYFPNIEPDNNSLCVINTSLKPYDPTKMIDKNHYRIGKTTNNAIILDKIDEKGNASTTIVKIPDELSSEKMWMKAFEEITKFNEDYFGITAAKFKEIHNELDKTARLDGKDITEEAIHHALAMEGYANAKKMAQQIFGSFREFYKPYNEKEFHGEKFPNDDLIQLAIQQVEARRQINPNKKFAFKTTCRAYALAVELYCESQHYDFRNDSTFKFHDLTKRKIDTFKELINSDEKYGFISKGKYAKAIINEFPDRAPPDKTPPSPKKTR